MVEFRHITITNEGNTERIDLNDFDGYLMTSPTGFGIYRTSEYITIGNQRVKTNNRNNFQKITFNVLILGERNEWENKYAKLRDFISKNLKKGFRLYYTPFEETRYIKCDINIVDKAEKDSANLPIKLEIQPLTLWLVDDRKVSIRQSEAEENNLFIFAEADDYSAVFRFQQDRTDEYGRSVYSISFISNDFQVATLNNVGMEDTPLKIRIYGKAVNPFITLRKYGGGVVQSVKFNDLTINAGYYLEINSDATDTHIELVNIETGARFDRENYADISTNIYLTLPVGKYDIEVTEESEEQGGYTEVYYSNQYYGG